MPRYETGVLLGAGATGEVYRALDVDLGRTVALKLIRRTDPVSVERMLREARAQARIEHPLVCKIFEVGMLSGVPFIAMQFVDGVTLEVAARGMTLEQKVRALCDVAGAVDAAHNAGLVHRDLKPKNIVVERMADGFRPYVTDFGLVHESGATTLTANGEVMGTPAYMSPEQARGGRGEVDARSDVYSLGVTMYEIICGALPFHGESAVDILIQSIHHAPRSPRKLVPTLSPELEAVILTCLAKDPSLRYPSAAAFALDLTRYLEGSPVQARASGALPRARMWAHRYPLGFRVFAMGAVALTLAALIALVASGPLPRVARGILPSCHDGARDGHEVDVDCGGDQCLPCRKGMVCHSDEDCAGGQCTDAFLWTDKNWKQSLAPEQGWAGPDFDDSAWSPAVEEGVVGLAPWGSGVLPFASPARWIWHYDSRGASDNDTVRFRRTFVAPADSFRMWVSGDDRYEVYLDGKKLGGHSPWYQGLAYDVALVAGKTHVLAFEVTNGEAGPTSPKGPGGPGGLLVDARLLSRKCAPGFQGPIPSFSGTASSGANPAQQQLPVSSPRNR